MASSLNVIALISGGKDSLFSILHCQANGHTIVALANLHPVESANSHEEDIDSYMYQTVGHSIVPLYEQALGLPLYRQAITGKAVNSSRDYEQSAAAAQEQDETEDLVPLLQRVMKAHPNANAVSTGAILSTYQRTRVESVALRLGLTPLSYLWQYPLLPPYTQSSLLHDMAAVGQEAVIIKTASGGLDESFLGLNVADRRTVAKLSKAMVRFGEGGNGAIVGEGGEFETLALDGPRGLWKRRIRLGKYEAKVVDGGQTIMRIKESRVEEKTEDEREGQGELRIPELFDEEFSKVLRDAEESDIKDVDPTTKNAPSATIPSTFTTEPSDQGEYIHNLSAFDLTDTPTVFSCPNLTDFPHPPPRSPPPQQLTVIFQKLDHLLQYSHLSKYAINHCTLLLRDMSDFTVLNPIYASYFNGVNPPARVTVAVGDAMPLKLNSTPSSPRPDVMLSVVLDKISTSDGNGISKRQGLHVQGRSYWAPANIGPYSQAISVPLPRRNHADMQEQEQDAGEIVYVAGQIPLIPASMELCSPTSFRGQAVLSLQHLWRIGRAKGVTCFTAGVAFIPASIEDAEGAGKVARDAWARIHTLASQTQATDDDENDGEDIDPWDRMNTSTAPVFNDSTYRAPIPSPSAASNIPPVFIVQVEALPRSASIEWSATGLTSPSPVIFSSIPDSHSHTTTTSPLSTSTSISHPSSTSTFHTLEIRDRASCEELYTQKWATGTLYVGRRFEWDEERGLEGVTWVPCFRVWGGDGEEVCGVFVGRVDGV